MKEKKLKLERNILAGILVVFLCALILLFFFPRVAAHFAGPGGDTDSKNVTQYTLTIPAEDGGEEVLSYGPRVSLARSDYFDQVKSKFIEDKAAFLEVDLSKMKVRHFVDGEVNFEADVLAKGKEGTWWETPPGIYKAGPKRPRQKSSFGNVYMPWIIPFEGNFFLHGWPVYPSGEPATGTTSGGCVRLGTEDAEKLYTIITEGTPILVHDDKYTNDTAEYSISGPDMKAEQYMAIDLKNSHVFVNGGEEEAVQIGTMITLLTALISSEHIGMEREITAQELPEDMEDSVRIDTGERYRVYDLLFPLLEDWSDEAAHALSSHLGISRFATIMNDKRHALGMEKSLFSAPFIGEENLSTPEDLFYLLRYVYTYRPFILDISGSTINTYLYGEPRTDKRDHPRIFPGYEDFAGGAHDKTTDSTVAVFLLEINGETRPVAFIALHSEDSLQDVLDMRRFILSNYTVRVAETSGE